MADISLVFFINFLIAIALGILVGVERELSFTKQGKEGFAGIRTFTIISIIGALTGYLAIQYSYWVIIAGMVCFSVFVISSYVVESRMNNTLGATTELAGIAVFIIGILCAIDQLRLAIISAIILTLLLSLKKPLHQFVHKVNREDIYSTLKFAIIAFIILPFLPNQTFGPFGIFNPYKTWLIVVLISGMSLVSYIAIKVVGTKKGMGLTGFFGGFISSTAVSMSMSHTSKKVQKIVNPFVFAMTIASATMFFRVLILIGILNNAILPKLLIPLIAMGVAGLIAAVFVWTRKDNVTEKEKDLKFHSPFSIGPALKFAAFFIVILAVSKLGSYYFGSGGMYATSVLSGLADIDAITVSVAELARANSITTDVAVTSIVIAVITNTIVKAGIANIFGSKPFKKKINLIFAVVIIVGLLSLLFV